MMLILDDSDDSDDDDSDDWNDSYDLNPMVDLTTNQLACYYCRVKKIRPELTWEEG